MADRGDSNDENVITATPPKEQREKRGRIQKKKYAESQSDDDAEMDDLEPSHEQLTPVKSESDEDYGQKTKKKRAVKRKVSADMQSQSEASVAKPAKKEKKQKVIKAKKAPSQVQEAPNMIKAQNRLIGVI